MSFAFRELEPVTEQEAEDFLYNGSREAVEMLGDTVVGPKEADKVAVIIHGFTGSNLENLYLANRMARAGIRVYLPLLPGHGTDFEDLKGYNDRDWTDKVAEVLKQVRVMHPEAKLIIMGHSLGGPIALNGYHESRVDIDGLVFLASPFRYPSTLRWRVKLLKWLPLKIPFAGFRFTDKKLYGNALVNYFDKKYEYIYMKSAGDAFRAMEKAFTFLPKVKVPVLLIYSKIDYRVPFNQALLVKGIVQHAKLIAFDKGDHVLQIDSDRKEVAKAIIKWIETILQK